MESRLPKPSGLKRPGTVPKTVSQPSDRIKAGGASSSTSQTVPLTKDPISSRANIHRMVRGGSPEPRKMFTLPSKLRRSRSACDINEMRDKKRQAAPIAASAAPATKMTRFNHTTATHSNSYTSARRMGGNFTTSKPISSTSSASSGKMKPSVSTKAPAPVKRIAPYDFKARFHDLLEKHKSLKAKYEKLVEDMSEVESLPQQLEETTNKLIETEATLKNELSEKECLQRQVKQQSTKLDSITISFGRTKDELTQVQGKYTHLKTNYEIVCSEMVDIKKHNDKIERMNEELSSALTTCKEQLFKSNMERKELHNTIMDLRGNIRVFCRVRPPIDHEESRSLCGWAYHDDATVEIQNNDGKNKSAPLTFTFDQVFHPNSTQTDIFEMVSPMIQSAMDGYNVCIFAYGQTGSGKTFTMDGTSDNIGVIPRTVELLFDSISHYRFLGWEYEIKATFVEIYNEVLYDLLSNEQKDMEIRMSKANKNDIYVTNITEATVTTPHQLRQLMNTAKMNRATAATAGNERSSRSHAVTKLELIGRHAEKQETCVGCINLVDLAGSESPKTSIRMIETKNINRSLSELTNVVLALLQKQDHIPYRNSKLTHLLMPSLGGNSKTLMFINVAPFLDCFQESVKSLRFAANVNSCKMAKAKRNRYLNTSVVNANNSTVS